jgi:hypothetical protein
MLDNFQIDIAINACPFGVFAISSGKQDMSAVFKIRIFSVSSYRVFGEKGFPHEL